MAGNVWEWVEDYGNYYAGVPEAIDGLESSDLAPSAGFTSHEEIWYLFRGAAACVRQSLDAAVAEVRANSANLQPTLSESDLLGFARIAKTRFHGVIKDAPPNRAIRTNATFADLDRRARARRREIGAFIRGLDLDGMQLSQLDTHCEAGVQSLVEWRARLERMAASREVDGLDLTRVHGVLDQVESITEMLMVDVELTMRRYKEGRPARVLRGGSWDDAPSFLTASSRFPNDAGDRQDNFGFRCSRDVFP